MGDPLRDMRLKLARAEEHLTDLQARIDAWAAAHVIDTVHEHDRESGWHILRVREIPPVPELWSAILADYAINLRTPLDYLVRELVIANGGTPGRYNKFPIFAVPPDKGWLKDALRGAHPEARAQIKQLQPYLRPNRPEPEPLEVLAGLANIDKHVRPHGAVVLSAPFDHRRVVFTPRQNVSGLISRIPIRIGSPVSGAELIGMRFLPPEADIEMEMQGNLPVEVAFGDPAVPMSRLNQLITVVRTVIDGLSPFITGSR